MHQLAQCLAKTQCVAEGRPAKQCMAAGVAPECSVSLRSMTRCSGRELPASVVREVETTLWSLWRCAQLYRRAFFECKRGQLDMRTRIRGQRYTDILKEADDQE